MTAIIEAGLREKMVHFVDAAQGRTRGGAAEIRQMVKGHWQPDGEQLRGLQKLAVNPVQCTDDFRHILEKASSYMPDTAWCSLVLRSDNHLQRIKQAMADVKLTLSKRYQPYLDPLNMVAVLLPPLPGLFDWLSQLDGVSFMGDGDRHVDAPPRPGPALARQPMGPMEAMMRLMVQGDMPSDLALQEGSVRVAVIDSGIWADHPFMQGQIEGRLCLADQDIGPIDPDGHGTHVGGIIAGRWPEDRPGWGGIAPFARLLDIQLYSPAGTTSLGLIAGIGHAIKAGADILNLSMGAAGMLADGQSLEARAVNIAWEYGLIPVISAGNSGEKGEKTISVPADALHAICVAAVDGNGDWAPFSSMGPSAAPERTGHKPTLAAPGVSIVSLRSSFSVHPAIDQTGLYVAMDGTSMASPIVSGICALGLAYLRGKKVDKPSPDMVSEALLVSCVISRDGDAKRVGRGIPCVPFFLSELNRLVGKGTSVGAGTDQDQDAKAGRPAGGSGNKRVRDAVMAKLDVYRAAEASFLAGVKTSLERHGVNLAEATIRARKVRLQSAVEGDEENRIRGAVAAVNLDPFITTQLPVNGFWSVGINSGSSPCLRVVAKSFAAWTALAALGGGTAEWNRATVMAFIDEQSQDAKTVPVFFVLMSPEPWPGDVSVESLARPGCSILLCHPGQVNGKGIWHAAMSMSRSPEMDWIRWLALMPVSLDEMKGLCQSFLDTNTDLLLPHGMLGVNEAAAELQLPPVIALKLVGELLRDSQRLEVKTHGGQKYILRKMNGGMG